MFLRYGYGLAITLSKIKSYRMGTRNNLTHCFFDMGMVRYEEVEQMTSIYQCPLGKKVEVNDNGYKNPPKILKLRSGWYFEECIKCEIRLTSHDYYFESQQYFNENRIEIESYCKLKLYK